MGPGLCVAHVGEQWMSGCSGYKVGVELKWRDITCVVRCRGVIRNALLGDDYPSMVGSSAALCQPPSTTLIWEVEDQPASVWKTPCAPDCSTNFPDAAAATQRIEEDDIDLLCSRDEFGKPGQETRANKQLAYLA